MLVDLVVSKCDNIFLFIISCSISLFRRDFFSIWGIGEKENSIARGGRRLFSLPIAPRRQLFLGKLCDSETGTNSRN